jgi:hypothetical protein
MGEFERIFLLPVQSFAKDKQKLIKNNAPVPHRLPPLSFNLADSQANRLFQGIVRWE